MVTTMTIFFCPICAYEEEYHTAAFQIDGTILCRKHAISKLKNMAVSSASGEHDDRHRNSSGGWPDGGYPIR